MKRVGECPHHRIKSVWAPPLRIVDPLAVPGLALLFPVVFHDRVGLVYGVLGRLFCLSLLAFKVLQMFLRLILQTKTPQNKNK